MAKGMFTQGIAVLTSSAPLLDDVERALRRFHILGRPAVEPHAASWMGGHPALVLDWLPEHNGKLAVDVVPRPWPDDMGHPESAPKLFAAWVMGWFGPHAKDGLVTPPRPTLRWFPEAAASPPPALLAKLAEE